MSGHRPWRELRDRLRSRRVTTRDVDAEYRELVRAVATRAGHRPSEVANAFGGYMCECRRDSWLDLDEFDSGGGCLTGWAWARRALELHHRFAHRNDLLRAGDDGVLCRVYGCERRPKRVTEGSDD